MLDFCEKCCIFTLYLKNKDMNTTTIERKTINYRSRDDREFYIDAATCPINIYQFGIRGITLFRGTYIITPAMLAKLSRFHNMVDVSPIHQG